jgi:hypothetical protein
LSPGGLFRSPRRLLDERLRPVSTASREDSPRHVQSMPLRRPGMDYDEALGTEDFKTHELPLEDAPHGYEIFQKKEDGAVKIVLKP